jgi:tetratricopeptide (TPR) repeat protein
VTHRTAILFALLLLTICFSLATSLQPRSLDWRGQRAQADTLLKVLLGDGRRMFANHFFTKADVYLHSGYYPSIFDQAKLNCEGHLHGTAEDEAHEAHDGEGHDAHEQGDNSDILGKPKDWLDRFGRKFRITEHTHLAAGGTEREILPWLKLAAELDPQQVETYTVAAYWLRTKLGKVNEAESFLRDGLRANPDSFEILFDLGRLLYTVRKDTDRARNVWELALRKWQRSEGGKEKPDLIALDQILANLARLEEVAGNLPKAMQHLRRLEAVSPHPELIRSQIEELRRRLQPTPPPPQK